jgi:hypothetical protein
MVCAETRRVYNQSCDHLYKVSVAAEGASDCTDANRTSLPFILRFDKLSSVHPSLALQPIS